MMKRRCGPALGLAVSASAFLACEGGSADDDSTPADDDSTAADDDTTPPYPGSVSGTVTDDEGTPLPGAPVEQAGGSGIATVTDAEGRYTLAVPADEAEGLLVAAGYVGFRNGYAADLRYDEPWDIALGPIPEADNPDYSFQPGGTSGAASTEECGHCHTDYADEWQTSAHRRAASNPRTRDLYNGSASGRTDAAACAEAGGDWLPGGVPGDDGVGDQCVLGSGLLPEANPGACGSAAGLACDHPDAAPAVTGACAACHAPAQEGVGADDLDFNAARGVAFGDGVGCDLCHKAAAVEVNRLAGVDGSMSLRRPSKPSESPTSEYEPLMFGSLVDVLNPFMGSSWQPQFAEAGFCSACHEYAQPQVLPGPEAAIDELRWPDGIPVHETYSEWEASWAAMAGRRCQDCHMPPTEAINTAGDFALDVGEGVSAGWERPPEEVRSHAFVGPVHDWGGLEPLVGALADTAVTMSLTTARDAGEVTASVMLLNTGAGHAVPTGEPLRRLVLLVRAVDAAGDELPLLSGSTVPDLGSAVAEGVVGTDTTLDGDRLSVPSAAPGAAVGDEVRFVRDSGVYADYPPVGEFGALDLPPEDAGLPVRVAVATVRIAALEGATLVLDAAPLGVVPGDRVFVGAPPAWPGGVGEDLPALPLAGAAGWAFGKVLVGPEGARDVPHFRAVDVASDNRLAPSSPVTLPFSFGPAADGPVAVEAVLLYRSAPYGLAAERGWTLDDHVMARSVADVP